MPLQHTRLYLTLKNLDLLTTFKAHRLSTFYGLVLLTTIDIFK